MDHRSKLEKLTVVQLKEIIDDLNSSIESRIKKSGTKAEIVERILPYYEDINFSYKEKIKEKKKEKHVDSLTEEMSGLNLKRGQIYVGKKAGRGKTGEYDPKMENVLNINATSGSMNKINGVPAKQFSPMILGPVIEKEIFGTGDLSAKIFENYWQYGKKFKELGHLENRGGWMNFRKVGYEKNDGDRHPVGTKSDEVKYVENGKNHYRYYTAASSEYLDTEMDYLTARKYIYVQIYAYLVSQTEAFVELKKMVDSGKDVMILDFDVLPGYHLVTKNFLQNRVNDPTFPFGHGYVLAGLLSDIQPDDYIN